MRILAPKRIRRRLRPVLLVGITAIIIAQIVALTPSSLEESAPTGMVAIDPESLVPETESEITDGPVLGQGRIPDYSVDKFNYVSARGTEKLWRLIAQKAYLYNKENLVHAKGVEASLFDPDGKATLVTGREARYFMNKRDLEVFGDVKAVFPDGFELHSDYLRYRPQVRKVEIPVKYPVMGTGQGFEFLSHGMDFSMGESRIVLPESVEFIMDKSPGTHADHTKIESDQCVIFRNRQIAHFTMDPGRPLDKRFVYITKPTLLSRGRRAQLNYGDLSKILQYLVIEEDVLIKETGKKESLRYATSGKAAFDTRRDIIVLSEFPQVYQDNDTVTGEVIIVHRDSDVVEVEQSNAYSQGK
jgi:LPS export ABC transporter protein LptC